MRLQKFEGVYLQPSVSVRTAAHACQGLLASHPPDPRGARARVLVTESDHVRGTCRQT